MCGGKNTFKLFLEYQEYKLKIILEVSKKER